MLTWVAQRLATYGYWAVALVVMGESLGLPLPGETLLLLGTGLCWGGLSRGVGRHRGGHRGGHCGRYPRLRARTVGWPAAPRALWGSRSICQKIYG